MQDILFWISFFGPPLFIVLLTIWVFRPSARQYYHDVKHEIFNEDETLEPGNKPGSVDHSLRA